MFQTDGEIFTASEIEDCATADLTPPQGFDRLLCHLPLPLPPSCHQLPSRYYGPRWRNLRIMWESSLSHVALCG
jgi:hypothetical protein